MRTPTLTLLATALLTAALSSCAKDAEDVAQGAGILPTTCGSDGARVQATVDGNAYCGNAQVLATGGEGTVMVTGVDLLGNTLIIQADSLAVGTQAITDATNGVMYMHNGTPYVVQAGQPGTLHITQVDTVAHILKADFDVLLRNEMSGNSHAVQGSLDVVYTTGG